MIRVGGQLIDMPDAERGWQRFDAECRADRRASRRLGYRQREAVGEAFWTHPYCPGVCFPTRQQALQAALARAGRVTVNEGGPDA